MDLNKPSLPTVKLVVLAECYANAGFADVLAWRLNDKIRSRNLNNRIYVETICHTPKQGIDVVFKRARYALCRYTIGIAVVDYETGEMRRYVDRILAQESSRLGNIVIRVGKIPPEPKACHDMHNKPLIGIVFDPRIEEALICRIDSSFCRYPEKRRLIKSREGRKIVRDLVSKNCADLIAELVKLLLHSAIPQALESCRR